MAYQQVFVFTCSNPQFRDISGGLFPYVVLLGNTVDIPPLSGFQGSRTRKLTQGQISVHRKRKDKSLEVEFLGQRRYVSVCVSYF